MARLVSCSVGFVGLQISSLFDNDAVDLGLYQVTAISSHFLPLYTKASASRDQTEVPVRLGSYRRRLWREWGSCVGVVAKVIEMLISLTQPTADSSTSGLDLNAAASSLRIYDSHFALRRDDRLQTVTDSHASTQSE